MSDEESSKLKWVTDIPFNIVPFEIVSEFNGHRFTPTEFYESDIWTFPNHWNAALFFENKMILFVYGMFDPLEKDLYVKRVAADKEFQMGTRPNLIQIMLDKVDEIASKKGAVISWTMASKRGLFRKGMGRGEINKKKFIWEHENA